MKLLPLLFILTIGTVIPDSAFAKEKLLDKIVAVINNKVISLSELKRMEATLDARKEISPIIYPKSSYDLKGLLDIVLRSYIIRDKINAQGFVINDDAVESRIKMTEERLGLRRADLLTFLKSKKITFEEYFEIIRETMEFNVFASRVISPLITVTEQEIKNEYYRKHSSNKALSFKYNLVDFFIPESQIIDKNEEKFYSVIKDYQLTGKLPEEYKELESNKLDDLNEDALPKELASVLKKANEGSFTKAVSLNGYLHVFYVQKKDLVESQNYAAQKDQIQNEIFSKKGNSVSDNWFEREYQNYYIKNLL